MRLPKTKYKPEPCPGCGRYCVRFGKRLCSGCESRLRRGCSWIDLQTDYKDNNQPVIKEENVDQENALLDGIRSYFRRGPGKRGTTPLTIIELADRFDCSPQKIRNAVSELQNRGMMLEVVDGFVGLETSMPSTHDEERIDISKFKGRTIRFGLTADNHLGSKYYRADVLNALFDIWEGQGITEVYQCGNMIEGECSFNRHDLMIPPGVESQVDYFVNNWPQRKGITTRFVCGDDHEGWYTKFYGANVGAMIIHAAKEAGRNDLEHLGYMEHDVVFHAKNGACKMRVVHAGGGTAYALSYSVQKIVESYQGGEKPNILLVGHFHKAEYSYPREVHVVQAACTQDQTPFMRKKKIQAMMGGWTISFTLDDNGIVHDFMPQFHAFYDRQFYRTWKYLWK